MSLLKDAHHCLVFIMICLSSVFSEGRADCRETLAKSLDEPTRIEQVHKEVGIVWYPDQGLPVGHVELVVDGKMWNPVLGYEPSGILHIAIEKALKYGQGFYYFRLNVTKQELERLEAFLAKNNGKDAWQTCVGGACSAFYRNTGVKIPAPFSQVPSLTALYLAVAHKLKYKRILGISYYGHQPAERVLRASVPFELGATFGVGALGVGAAAVGYFFIFAENKGNKEVLVVPVDIDTQGR